MIMAVKLTGKELEEFIIDKVAEDSGYQFGSRNEAYIVTSSGTKINLSDIEFLVIEENI